MMIIIADISIVPYLGNKGDHAGLHKSDKSVYIKTSKIIII